MQVSTKVPAIRLGRKFYQVEDNEVLDEHRRVRNEPQNRGEQQVDECNAVGNDKPPAERTERIIKVQVRTVKRHNTRYAEVQIRGIT